MALVIRQRGLLISKYLKVTDREVIFMETAFIGGKKRFKFGQIDYVLMSADNVLSFQVGGEVFSIQVKPEVFKHQQALEQLLTNVNASVQGTGGFPVQPIAGGYGG